MRKVVNKSKKKKAKSKIKGGFFNSNTAKLFFIIIILMAIPLTVLGVQRVQNLQQEAAYVPKAACDGDSTGLLVEQRPAIKGQKITFKHTEVNDLPPIDQQSFEQWDFLGNGVVASSCQLVGDTIECTARGTASPGQISKHTWQFRELALCEYEVRNDDPKSTPTPTKDPNGTPRPTRTTTTAPAPTRQAGGNLTVGLKAADCNVSNEPRLRANWDLRGAEGPNGEKCKVELIEGSNTWMIDNRCTNVSGKIIDAIPGEDDNLKQETEYTLKVTRGDGETAQKAATTLKCAGGSVSPTASTNPPGFGTPESVSAKCDGNQDEPKMTVSWKKVNGAVSYIVKLSQSQGGSILQQETTESTSYTFENIEKDKNYWYSVMAVDASGNKSGATSNTRNLKCTNENLSPSGVITAIANTFEEMMSWLNL